MTRPVLGVVCDSLRAQVTAKKDSVVLKSSIVLTHPTIVEHLDTSLLGVVCDLLRAQVTAEKDRWCSRSASVMV